MPIQDFFRVQFNGTCNIIRQSQLVSLLVYTYLIIWNEVFIQNKESIATVNTILQDICGTENLFGDISIILGGDFAQILPIIPQRNREAQVNTSIC